MTKAETIIGLGFGANIGDSAGAVAAAIRAVEARGVARLVAVSSLWRTQPWGRTDQPAFANACALAATKLDPHPLLTSLQDIERDMGRVRAERWGPRAIDIDILFYGDARIDDPDLVLPHREMLRRGFVLAPLAEIAPGRRIGETIVRDALTAVDRSGLTIEAQGPDWVRARSPFNASSRRSSDPA